MPNYYNKTLLVRFTKKKSKKGSTVIYKIDFIIAFFLTPKKKQIYSSSAQSGI